MHPRKGFLLWLVVVLVAVVAIAVVAATTGAVVVDTAGPEVTRGGAVVGPAGGAVVDTTGGWVVLATGGAVVLTTAGAVVLEAAPAVVVIGSSFVVPGTPLTVALFLSAPITMSNEAVVGIVCVPEMFVVPSALNVTVAPEIMPWKVPSALIISITEIRLANFYHSRQKY